MIILTRYEDLASSSDARDIHIYDRKFNSPRIRGLYCDGNVAISNDIDTEAEKACVLAEEIGHHATSSGNILDQSSAANRKQERTARVWAYNRLIGLSGIVECYKAGCRNPYEMAEQLGITEEFLTDALTCYKQRYGTFATTGNYIILFEPSLSVIEIK